MKKLALVVALGCVGCGGKSSVPTIPIESMWAGTYTGVLDLSQPCITTPCPGDSVSITISEGYGSPYPSEYDPTITITGTDLTKNEAITGTGTVLYVSPAMIGPGSQETTGGITLTPGGEMFLSASGSSTTSNPILMQTVTVKNGITVDGSVVPGAQILGTLTRQN